MTSGEVAAVLQGGRLIALEAQLVVIDIAVLIGLRAQAGGISAHRIGHGLAVDGDQDVAAGLETNAVVLDGDALGEEAQLVGEEQLAVIGIAPDHAVEAGFVVDAAFPADQHGRDVEPRLGITDEVATRDGDIAATGGVVDGLGVTPGIGLRVPKGVVDQTVLSPCRDAVLTAVAGGIDKRGVGGHDLGPRQNVICEIAKPAGSGRRI
ncbi:MULTISPECIES: hypothetical protein [unclassified Synechococcus]|uniref:hypothetical protein n=1 Tax=unclassified Synechococcus TaxID=2626047 RepID=UPI0039B0EADD